MRNILLKRNTVYILGFGICLLFIVPLTAWGQADEIKPLFKPLVGIPGITDLSEETTLPQYFNAIYVLTISIAALIGVIKIAIAGVKYTMGDVVTNKASALQDIRGVLFGLALLLIPFIVLQTIYKDLTSLDVLKNVKAVNEPKPPPKSSGATSPNDQVRVQGILDIRNTGSATLPTEADAKFVADKQKCPNGDGPIVEGTTVRCAVPNTSQPVQQTDSSGAVRQVNVPATQLDQLCPSDKYDKVITVNNPNPALRRYTCFPKE